MTCPVCKSVRFYVKHPEDPYETSELEIKNGDVRFDPPDESVSITMDSRIYCERCAWNDRLKVLKK